ncbi:hypothetical protein CEXT_499311, partial [Caerostris extrusa]
RKKSARKALQRCRNGCEDASTQTIVESKMPSMCLKERETPTERPSSRDEMKQDMDMALELYNQVIDTESNMTKIWKK